MVHATPWQPQYVQLIQLPCDNGAAYTNPTDVRSVAIFPPTRQYIDGQLIEAAYWHNQTLFGRQIVPSDVLAGYQTDPTSLRSGFFLQKLCLQSRTLEHQPVQPDRVITEFNRARGSNNKCQLAIAHFKSICCLNGLSLKNRYISPEEVAGEFKSINALLELARFKEQCFKIGLPLFGQLLTIDSVLSAFKRANAINEKAFFQKCPQQHDSDNLTNEMPDRGQLWGLMDQPKAQRPADFHPSLELMTKNHRRAEDLVRLGRFLEQCCLDNIYLHNQPVLPEVVFETLYNANAPRELARFLQQLFLRDRSLFGQPVPPEVVVRAYETLGSVLTLGRFSAICCLRGLLIDGNRVTAEAVKKLFRTARAPLELARFKAECCISGTLLHDRLVSPDEVVRGYMAINAIQECGRFRQHCLLKGIPLNGQPVTPEIVVDTFRKANTPLCLARFMELCCLKKLLLSGQPVSPEQVLDTFPTNPAGRLSAMRFKEHCFLKDLPINGVMITPEEMVRDYEHGGWKLEKAVFYTHLILNARKLHGQYLDNQKVMQAFADAPGRHMKKKMQYLLLRLNTLPALDDTGELLDTFKLALEVINEIPRSDGYYGYQRCLLSFFALQYGLSIDDCPVTPEQIWQLMTQLRYCYRRVRLQFFFLAHCCKAGIKLYGKQVDRQQVMSCLLELPREIKLRHALAYWFESFCDSSDEAGVVDRQVLRHNSPQARTFADSQQADREPTSDDVLPTLLTIAAVSPMARKVLSIIQEINDTPGAPPLQITGSFSRYLQGVSASFRDIDIIGTQSRVQALLTRMTCEIPQAGCDVTRGMHARPSPGCPQLRLPMTINLVLTEGDLDSKTLLLQVSTYDLNELSHYRLLPVLSCAMDKPIPCLAFVEEVSMMSDAVKYLVENLDTLTAQLQGDDYFSVPRTILFNFPKNPEERVCGLLMRTLLTVSKARQFCQLLHDELSAGCKSWGNHQHERYRAELITLSVYTRQLQVKLYGHPCYELFTSTVKQGFDNTLNGGFYDIKRHIFVQNLLKTLVAEPYSPGNCFGSNQPTPAN